MGHALIISIVRRTSDFNSSALAHSSIVEHRMAISVVLRTGETRTEIRHSEVSCD